MTKHYQPVKTLIAALVGMTLTASVMAADMSKDSDRMSPSQYNETVKSTKAEYKSALKACGTIMGAERTACRKEARANRNSAMSDARAKRGPMSSRIGKAMKSPATEANAGGAPKSANETAGPSSK